MTPGQPEGLDGVSLEARELRRLQALAEAWRLLAPLERPEEVYRAVVETAKAATRAVSVLLFLHRPHEDVLELVAAQGLSQKKVGFRLRRGEGISWVVLEKGEPLYLADVTQDPRVIFLSGRPQPGVYLGVPLRNAEGKAFGVLSMDTAGGVGEILPEEEFWIQALAEAAGLVLARIEALELAKAEAARAQALLELSLALEAARDPLVMAKEALETLLRLTPYHAGALYLFQEGTARLAVTAGRYPLGFTQLYEEYPIHFGEGLLGHPRLWEGPVYVEDYAQFPRALRPYVESGLRSALLVPLRPEGRRYGVLALGSFEERVPYNPKDEKVLRLVAKRLEEALERLSHLRALDLSREAALKALGQVLEYRDLETKGHTERVVELALRLGRAVGFPDLEGLRLGAYFHDLGKLALPDEILRKPTVLHPDEWRVVKTHPQVGLEILKNLPFLPQTALNVVLYHHERWDGSGYPRGLKREEIPLEARIFAVADVYDALLSPRPYKRAWMVEEAKKELGAQAGKGLDPKLVAVFLDLV
ncbi:phosphohydrolase [Thermus scotoductus]|uniref:Phosphohydrolase n=1 Tax=Thermus scotoductus TaxID=37636 RepID=A0A430S6S9_THESC|nr:HD domain-containing phosphohydrolase [Thermus scotoductus]RTG94298.1 phosphohydrolase [Thermus scotoductus]RTH07432.1 phosphohydrolase [Thermus scotoductus]RTH09167.1 phosphohydrolase [Thermus scotoductus]RTH10307.1 phosphohydrolase [Thermus scotoductus]RTH20301.1 phosphohydrolase [Thermus scotoductus]